MRVGDDWLLTPERVAVYLPSATAVVADLHLGYGMVRRRSGEAVPAPPLAVLLAPLGLALARHGVRRLVIAGDLFEDGRCQREETVTALLRWLETTGTELVGVVKGNHDRGLGAASELPLCPEGTRLGPWSVVHGDGERPSGPVVQGHEHPWARWSERLSAPCYLLGQEHLVLPAYSLDAAGVNVLGARRWARYRCCVIAGEKVLDFGDVAELRKRFGGPR